MKKIKPCATCPFRKDTANYGRIDYLQDVFVGVFIRKSIRHTCHKTDPKADGYVNHTPTKRSVCWGFVSTDLKSNARTENVDAFIEMSAMNIDHSMIDGSETFDSIHDFFAHHFSKYGISKDA